MVQNVAFLETDFLIRKMRIETFLRPHCDDVSERERKPAPFKKLSTDLFQRQVFFDLLLSSSAWLRTSTAFFDFEFRIIFANPIRLQTSLRRCRWVFLVLDRVTSLSERQFSAEINHQRCRAVISHNFWLQQVQFSRLPMFVSQLGVEWMSW